MTPKHARKHAHRGLDLRLLLQQGTRPCRKITLTAATVLTAVALLVGAGASAVVVHATDSAAAFHVVTAGQPPAAGC